MLLNARIDLENTKENISKGNKVKTEIGKNEHL
jgi:hypothetical protein